MRTQSCGRCWSAQDSLPFLRGYPEPVGGLGYTATHMFYYPRQRTHVILNFHAHARMQASFMAHIRLARLVKEYG